ncbi:Elp3 domain-containing protein [Candidatus Hydrogenisulfobacillus filiaventi]|uniref:Elp3 domain-containing protein n=1 Tax=Candidatus Hydrogenisulfobacillus filiaventi TaxID=2707344 RepID=A0A6F8ZIM3_9FIRM|nr:radical SAM protein [Bacillota bacterium]CAB1129837.1 Elp3 domain-containing protein [Candidatus Hydrogenisulfobacillus filiaventi]
MMSTANWLEERVEDLVARARATSRAHFPAEILFAAPSQKHYDGGEYRNEPHHFETISVTGSACALKCDHCGTRILQSMHAAKSPARFRSLGIELAQQGAEGVLVSGGCLEDGTVPLDRFLDALAELKAQGMRVLVHSGLVRPEVARGLKAAGVDQVLLDIIGDNDTIREVYHLDRTVEAYRESLRLLAENGLAAVPHVVVGLHYGRIRGEFEALRMIQEEGAAQLVIVVLEPLPGTAMAGLPPVPAEDVARVLAAARLMMPEMPISLGCAKPPGPVKEAMERYAVDVGVQSIAYPLPATIAYARSQGVTARYHQQCCSVL